MTGLKLHAFLRAGLVSFTVVGLLAAAGFAASHIGPTTLLLVTVAGVSIIVLAVTPLAWSVGALIVSYAVAFNLVFVYPLGQQTPLRLDDFIVIVLAARVIVELLRRPLRLLPQYRAFLGFVGLLMIWEFVSILVGAAAVRSAPTSTEGAKNLYFWLKSIEYLVPCFAMLLCPSIWPHRAMLMRALVCQACIVAVYGMLQWGGIVPARGTFGIDATLDSSYNTGVTSTLSMQHAVIGLYILLLLPLLAMLFSHTASKRGRLTFGVLSLSFLMLLYLSESRSAWVGLFVMALIALQRAASSKRASRLLAAVAAVVALGGIGVVGVGEKSPVSATLRSIDPRPLAYASTYSAQANSREFIWSGSVALWLANPQTTAFGVGFGTFPLLQTPEGPASGAHNTYLMIAVELGLLGLILLACVLWSLFRAASLRLSKFDSSELALRRAYLLGLLGVLVGSISVDTFFPAIALENFLGIFWTVTALTLMPGTLGNDRARTSP